MSDRKLAFIYASDTHLRGHMWASRPEIEGDAFESFEFILRYARQAGVPLVLGGDIFDSKFVDSKTLSQFVRYAYNFGPSRIYFVDGNHDLLRNGNPSWATFSDKCKSLDNNFVDFGKFVLAGSSFTGDQRLFDERCLDAVDNPAIQNLNKAVAWVCHEPVWSGSNRIDLASAANMFALILIGDYHVNMVAKTESESCLIVSNGSTVLTAFGEPVDKYLTEVYDDLSVEFVRIPTRYVAQVQVQSEADIKSSIASIRKQLAMFREKRNRELWLDERPLVRVIVPNPNVASLVTEELKTLASVFHFHHFVHIRSVTDGVDFVQLSQETEIDAVLSELTESLSTPALTLFQQMSQIRDIDDHETKTDKVKEYVTALCNAELLNMTNPENSDAD